MHIMEYWQTHRDAPFHNEMIWITHIYKNTWKSYVHALLILSKHFYNILQILSIFPLEQQNELSLKFLHLLLLKWACILHQSHLSQDK